MIVSAIGEMTMAGQAVLDATGVSLAADGAVTVTMGLLVRGLDISYWLAPHSKR